MQRTLNDALIQMGSMINKHAKLNYLYFILEIKQEILL